MASGRSSFTKADDDHPSGSVVPGLKEVVLEDIDVDDDLYSFILDFVSLEKPTTLDPSITPTSSLDRNQLSYKPQEFLKLTDQTNSNRRLTGSVDASSDPHLGHPEDWSNRTGGTTIRDSGMGSSRTSTIAEARATISTQQPADKDRLKLYQNILSTTDKPNAPITTPNKPNAPITTPKSGNTTPTNASPTSNVTSGLVVPTSRSNSKPPDDFIQQQPIINIKTVQTEAKVANPRLKGSRSRKEQIGQVELKLRRFQLLLNEGRIDEAMKDFRDALSQPDQPEQLKHVHARVCGQLGKLLLGKERPREALEILTKGLDLYESGQVQAAGQDDFNTLWSLHDDIATCNSRRGNKVKEAEHYEQAILLLSTTSVPPMRYPHMMNNLGNCYKTLGQYEKALTHLENARDILTVLHIAEGGEQANEDLLKVLSSLASLYMEMDKINQAEAEFIEIIRYTENSIGSMESAIRMMDAKRNLKEIYIRQGRPGEAEKYQQDDLGAMNELISAIGDGDGNTGGKDDDINWGKALGHAKHVSSAQASAANGDHTSAIRHYNEALEDLKKNGTMLLTQEQKDDLEASIFNNMGHSYQELGDFDSALVYISQALEIHEKQHGSKANTSVASSHFNLGNLQLRIAEPENFREAKRHFQAAINQYELLGANDQNPNQYTHWLARAYKGIGYASTNLSDSHNAISAYESAREIYTKLGEPHEQELALVLNNLGNAYEERKDYYPAARTLKQTLKLQQTIRARTTDPTHAMELASEEASCLNNLGCVYRSRGDYDEAEKYWDKSFNLRAKECVEKNYTPALEDLTTPPLNMANMYMQQKKDYKRALEILLKAEEYAKRYDLDLTKIKLQLSVCYENLGDMTQAELMVRPTPVGSSDFSTANPNLSKVDRDKDDSLDLGLSSSE